MAMDDDGSPLSWFGLGNVKDKLDSFCSDVDRIIFQDAENLILSAGTSVKQFCAEFMEEMLPDALKEKNSAPLEPSNDASPCPMEMVENESTESSLGVENNVVQEQSFEEIRVRDTANSPPKEVNDHHNLPQNPSSKAAEEKKSSNPIEKLLADIEVELSTMELSSSTLQVFSDVKKELLDGSNVTTEFSTEVWENQGPSFRDDFFKEVINLNDASDERKVEEIAATHVSKSDAKIQSFRPETSDDTCIMMDSKPCPIPDLHEENPTLQESLCTSCLDLKSDDESDCEKVATRSMDKEAEFDGFGGNSIWIMPSENADQSSSETDWVMV